MGINISLDLFKQVNVTAPSDADLRKVLREDHVGARPTMTNVSVFNVGDVVKIIDDVTRIMGLQKGHGGWISTMMWMLGKVGIVRSVLANGDILASVFGKTFVLNPECCEKAPPNTIVQGPSDNAEMREMMEKFSKMTSDFENLLQNRQEYRGFQRQHQQFSAGDVIQIIEDIQKVKVCQKGHGGWVDDMTSILGNIAEVQLALPTGTLVVLVSGKLCLLNSECCKKVSNPIDDIEDNFKSMDYMTQQCFRTAFNSTAAEDKTMHFQEFKKKLLEEDFFENTDIHDAICEGDEKIIDRLINNPDIDFTTRDHFGYNALHQAAIKGNNYATERILQKCKDIVDIKTEDGFTALHFAVIHGHQEVANTLLTLGEAQVDIRNHFELTPFLLATSGDHIGLIELLLTNGADINAEDKDGNTCLHFAISKQTIYASDEDSKLLEDISIHLGLGGDELPWEVIAGYLVQKGADIYHRNHQNVMPLDITCDQSSIEKLVKLASMFTTEHSKEEHTAEPQSNTRDCLLCSEEQANILFQPCSHVLICDNCNKIIPIENCLQCNEPIANKIKIQDDQEERVVNLITKFTCKICLNCSCNMAFDCGHTACTKCGERLKECHVCRKPIQKKLNLF
ncbi:E3 ubiquitin-protein ligase MIB2-like isoform X1 [Octopus sinensis]|uniref:RING-type E3 ubiquitin transferase n=2 Tax=Octopus sinensis TaxID=2607531 RepID=A0A6P7U4G3_9MOLL|nr:E3 ubiquitin-protein ligase MIB2-like isoform X1 [Octopus sinensis]